MQHLEEYRIEINGFRYQYYDNQKDGQAIIFIHGLGSNKDPMTKFFGDFLDKFRCIFLDLPAHNKLPSYEFTKLEDFGDYVINFCNYLKLQDYHLVGFSFGGLVAIQTSKKLNESGKIVKTVAWASPLQKSFLTFKSKQFLRIFDAVQNKYYKKLPKSQWFKILTAVFGIRVKDHELQSFTNFDNSRLDKFHQMMPDKQLNVKDIKVLYIFGTKDPLINDSAFPETIIHNSKQSKFLVERGGHYLTSEGRKEAVKLISDFIYS